MSGPRQVGSGNRPHILKSFAYYKGRICLGLVVDVVFHGDLVFVGEYTLNRCNLFGNVFQILSLNSSLFSCNLFLLIHPFILTFSVVGRTKFRAWSTHMSGTALNGIMEFLVHLQLCN